MKELRRNMRLVGMLVAVPLFAVIYDIIRKLIFHRLRKKGNEDMIAAYEADYHAMPEPVKRGRKGGKEKT